MYTQAYICNEYIIIKILLFIDVTIQHKFSVIEFYLHILNCTITVTLKHYGQLGITIKIQKDIERI
jgi:hypothetical protein